MKALNELSALLGVDVLHVRRDLQPTSVRIGAGPGSAVEPERDVFGRPKRRGWSITTADRTYYAMSSDELRQPSLLNNLTARMGRDPGLPRLTAADGRRVLRLLHEVIEEKENTRV